VASIDVDPAANMVQNHPRIDFLLGDSSSPDAVAAVRQWLPATRGTLFMILDADHSKAHVLRELEAWTPLLRRGDYLVVEDTCINGHPLRADFGPGPFEALEEFTARHPGLFERDVAREEKFGFTCAPRGYLIKT
jgi:cephalosporin hydroxylase